MSHAAAIPRRCWLTEEDAAAGQKRPRDPSDAAPAPPPTKLAPAGLPPDAQVELMRAVSESTKKLLSTVNWQPPEVLEEIRAAVTPFEHTEAAYQRIRELQARVAP